MRDNALEKSEIDVKESLLIQTVVYRQREKDNVCGK